MGVTILAKQAVISCALDILQTHKSPLLTAQQAEDAEAAEPGAAAEEA